jgi:DnaJ-class molecular chaperone
MTIRRCKTCGGRRLVGLGKKEAPCPTCRGAGTVNLPPEEPKGGPFDDLDD